jgi:hypothetical protein
MVVVVVVLLLPLMMMIQVLQSTEYEKQEHNCGNVSFKMLFCSG